MGRMIEALEKVTTYNAIIIQIITEIDYRVNVEYIRELMVSNGGYQCLQISVAAVFGGTCRNLLPYTLQLRASFDTYCSVAYI